ncbi:hypothetical protein [Sutcliffiella deserti]|uniref:hypothetical protein n=1 Tax=Sutcliffiella deserti TaxID=2875501 RepID=UPI001CBCFFF3|nr:hypothetical protein [Sutcliffiella deserti]
MKLVADDVHSSVKKVHEKRRWQRMMSIQEQSKYMKRVVGAGRCPFEREEST